MAIARLHRIVGTATIIVASLLGIESFGRAPGMVQTIYALGVFLLTLIGVALVGNASRLTAAIYMRTGIACVASLLALTLAEATLLIAGFPSEPASRYLHPPGISRIERTAEFEHHFRTNSLGIRDAELETEGAVGSRRILVLGDSFAEGLGVEEDARFSNLLQARRSGVRFLNAGLRGTGFLEQYRAFQVLDPRVQPDCILHVIYANDLTELPTEPPARLEPEDEVRKLPWLLPRIRSLATLLTRRANLEVKLDYPGGISATLLRHADKNREWPRREQAETWLASIPAATLREAEERLIEPFQLLAGLFRPTYWQVALDLEGPAADEKQTLARALLTRFKAAARGRPYAAVYIPTYFQYDPRSFDADVPWVQGGVIVKRSWLSTTSRFQDLLESEFKALNVPYLDLTSDFRAAQSLAPGSLVFRRDSHLTPAGHALVADRLDEFLQRTQFCSTSSADSSIK